MDSQNELTRRVVAAYEQRVKETLVDKARQAPLGPHKAQFIQELEAMDFDDDGPFGQGAPGSLTRLVSVALGPTKDKPVNIHNLYGNWELDYKQRLEREERQRYLEATIEVADFDAHGRLKKPRRIPKEEADVSWKPGCTILEEGARIEGRGFDRDPGATFVLRTTPIGTETPGGTIVAKRRLGGKVQYLLKPRSRAAEVKYQARLEIESLRGKLRDWEPYSPEQMLAFRERIQELEQKAR